MKFRIIGILLALTLVLACGFTVSGESSRTAAENFTTAPKAKREAVLLGRIENMLSHNFVYNDDFDSTTAMVDNAMLALLSAADDEGFIDAYLVGGFVYNMYGITLDEYEISADFPQKDTYLFVLPRGFDEFSHKVSGIEIDGEYIHVDSVMTVESHEGALYEYSCHTIFLENEESSFGYNIISSTYY